MKAFFMSETDIFKHAPRDSNALISRRVAAFAVKEVLENNNPLEQVLAGQEDYQSLEPRDRAFARLIAATTFPAHGPN